MTVPSSGAISLLGIVREKQNDDYEDTTAIQGGQGGNVVGGNGTISLESCATSGSNHSPQVVMEATNTNTVPHPNTSTPHAMSEFYGYDHDGVTNSGTVYGSQWNPAVQGLGGNENGTNDITHATRSAACASTNTISNCISALWTGTLGNGTTLYWGQGNFCGMSDVFDGNDRYIKMTGVGGIGGGCETDGDVDGHSMRISDSGVVSEYSTSCSDPVVGLYVHTTSYSKAVLGCGQPTNSTWYFPDATPAVDDQVYTNSNSTSPPSAGNYGYYSLLDAEEDTNYRFTVNSSGVITVVASC
tara:strand:- start:37 stop:936 length:900 start_codon:yes stop_codon:yes gene_type:complete